ncbi:hypothetical protein ABIA30_004534 [Mycobacterium sp. MAA66]|jgi:hypothetical protein|uniref:hypothetical protein n=1 Tax=Mycobacterium sp. MAA66 TaxID=3156297 RepID=UPI003513F8AE
MKNMGVAAMLAGGVVVSGMAFAAPAFASVQVKPTSMVVAPTGVDHLSWLDQIHHGASVPQVDTSVRHSR